MAHTHTTTDFDSTNQLSKDIFSQSNYDSQDNTFTESVITESIVQQETLRSLLRPASAEFIGSALFIFIACGSGMKM